MKHIPDVRSLVRNANATREFLHWLRSDGNKLIAAAQLLGGPRWAEQAEHVVAEARAGHDMAARWRELRALRRLLHLEFTTNVNSEEARRFAQVHPDDPRADEARLCAEALDKGVRALEALRLVGVANLREAA